MRIAKIKLVSGSWYTSPPGSDRWYLSSGSETEQDAREHAEGLWGADKVERVTRRNEMECNRPSVWTRYHSVRACEMGVNLAWEVMDPEKGPRGPVLGIVYQEDLGMDFVGDPGTESGCKGFPSLEEAASWVFGEAKKGQAK